MKLQSFAVVLWLASLTTNVEGAFLERDFLSTGDGLLTYDTENHREWLDLTYTNFVPIDVIRTEMRTGRFLEGFTFATLEDIQELLRSEEITWEDAYVADKFGFPSTLFIELFSEVASLKYEYENVTTRGKGSIITRYSFGKFATLSESGEYFFDGTSVSVTYRESYPKPNVRYPDGFNSSYEKQVLTKSTEWPYLSDSEHGPYFMYRSSIPEPNSFSLLCLMLLLYGLAQRKLPTLGSPS